MSETATAAPAAETSTPAPESGGGFIDSIDSFFSGLDGNTPAASQEPAPAVADTAAGDEPTAALDAATEPSDDGIDLPELDEVESVKDWTPQAAKRFKELKSELKTIKTRAEELEALAAQKDSRLQELEALANNPEYQQLQDRIQQYEQQMMLTQLESTTAYKVQIEEPLAELVTAADSIAEKYQIDSNSLLDAIAQDDEAAQEELLTELLANASDRDKFKVYNIIEAIKPILEQREVLRQNAEAALLEAQELETERNQYLARERAQSRQQAATAVADKLKSKLTFLSGMEGVDLSALAKEAAEVDPTVLDPVNATYQVMSAKLLPKMAAQYVALQREVEALTERLAEYDRATPRAGGGASSGYAPQTADGRSFLDAVTAAFGG